MRDTAHSGGLGGRRVRWRPSVPAACGLCLNAVQRQWGVHASWRVPDSAFSWGWHKQWTLEGLQRGGQGQPLPVLTCSGAEPGISSRGMQEGFRALQEVGAERPAGERRGQ